MFRTFKLLILLSFGSLLLACGAPTSPDAAPTYSPQLNTGPAPLGTASVYPLPDKVIFDGSPDDFDRNNLTILKKGLGCYDGYYAAGDMIFDGEAPEHQLNVLQRMMAGPNQLKAGRLTQRVGARLTVSVKNIYCLKL